MSVSVATANTNRQSKGTRVIVRTSAGIPYVIVEDTTDGGIEVWKGSGTSPASFTEQDTSNNPQSSGRYTAPSAVIDSSDIIHIAYWDNNGKSSALRYVTFVTSTDTFSGNVSVADVGGAGSSLPSTAIAIDANNIPHVVWKDVVANMGTDYSTIYYINRIGGSWNAQVEIEGATATKQCVPADIAIDSSNLPVISYHNTTDDTVRAAIGNLNNATSFTLQTVFTGSDNTKTETGSIVIDEDGNHWVGYTNSSLVVHIRKHNAGDTWSTWQAAVTNSNATIAVASSVNPILVAVGTDIYVFYEDDTDEDIVYDKYDGSSWDGETILANGGGGPAYNTPRVGWSNWLLNGSGGISKKLFRYYFDGNDEITDNTNTFSNDSNAADGSESTFATTTNPGSNSWLRLGGTTAPTTAPTGAQTIVGVFASLTAKRTSGAEPQSPNVQIFTDGEGQELLNKTISTPPSTVATYNLGLLSTPTGGWTWEKINLLEARLKIQTAGGSEGIDFARVSLTVITAETPAEIDVTYADAGGDIDFDTIAFAGDVTVTPSVLSMTASIQSPGKAIAKAAAALALTANLLAPTPVIAHIDTSQALTANLQGYTLQIDSAVSPSVFSLGANLQSPVPAVSNAPPTQDVTVSIQAPSYLISKSVTVQSIVAGLQNPVPEVRKTETVQSITITLNDPTTSTASDTTFNASALTITVNQNAPVPEVRVAENTLGLLLNLNAPTVLYDSTSQVSVQGVAVTLNNPTVVVTKSPSVQSIIASIQAPSVNYDSTFQATALSVSISQNTAQTEVLKAPTVLAISPSIQTPSPIVDKIVSELSTVVSIQAPVPEVRYIAAALTISANLQDPAAFAGSLQQPAEASMTVNINNPITEVRLIVSTLSLNANVVAPITEVRTSATALTLTTNEQQPVSEVVAAEVAQSLTININEPTVVIVDTVTPAAQIATVSLNNPVPEVRVSPSALSISVGDQTPDDEVAPDQAAASLIINLIEPTVIADSPGQAQPNAQTIAISINAPALVITKPVSAVSATIGHQAPVPVVSVPVGPQTVSPTINDPSILAGVVVQPSPLSISVSIVDPVPLYGNTFVATAVSITVNQIAPNIGKTYLEEPFTSDDEDFYDRGTDQMASKGSGDFFDRPASAEENYRSKESGDWYNRTG